MVDPLRALRTAVPVAFLLSLAVGCGSDAGIRAYTVPPPVEVKDSGPAQNFRILGALYPADAPTWFFKFTGSAEQVAKYEADFDKLAATVRLAAEPTEVPSFTLPEGWTRGGPRTARGIKIDETIKFGPGNAQQEVTITNVPGGGILQNVGRWANQLGLPEPRLDNIGRVTREFDANGVKGLRVDLRGPNNPAARMGPMGKGGR